MNVESITNNARFKSSVETLNNVGQRACEFTRSSINTVADKFRTTVDSFELSDFTKQSKVAKNTAIGAGIVILGTLLALKCIKGIKKAIINLKKDI